MLAFLPTLAEGSSARNSPMKTRADYSLGNGGNSAICFCPQYGDSLRGKVGGGTLIESSVFSLLGSEGMLQLC